jgi:hypothetical protein
MFAWAEAWSCDLKKIVTSGFFVWGIFFNIPIVFGSEILSTADLYSSGSFSVSLGGIHVEKDFNLDVNSDGGNETVFQGSSSGVEMQSESVNKVIKFAFRPYDGLLYYVKVGQICGFEMSYSSGSQTNTFESKSIGMLWGVGFRWNITQDTPVSAAMAFDVSYTALSVGDVDVFKAGSETFGVNDKFGENEIQGAFNISKRFGSWQPYGGLKVIRVDSKLVDKATNEQISGQSFLLSPFVGMQWEIFPKEYFVLESSFVDEKIFAGSIKVNF